MKSGSVLWWNLILAAVALCVGAGCVEGAASGEQTLESSNVVAVVSDSGTNVSPVEASVETNAPLTGAPEAEVPDITTADVKPIITERPLPPTIRSNSPVADIMRLADSGVEESVLLAFVTNSTSTFSLSANDIIYLNDIGIPSSVVTTILEHDKALRAASVTNEWSAQTPVPAETANPAPQDMAPQVAEQPPPAQESPAPPPSEVTYNNFYSSLSPYGTWVDVSGYGRCWQPTAVVVNPSWQPYMNCGRWAYTDYGWYWASDYTWGWAPFHYGRWFNHYRLGWCWYPDTIWGPSWVSWRYTDAYCGWAPLPPCAWYRPGFGLTYWGSSVGVSFSFGLSAGCYSFVGWNHFYGHRPYDYAVPYGNRQHIYNQSVVATKISGNRNNVFNHGIPLEHVERATGSQIKRVAIHEVSTPLGRGVRPEKLSSDGRSLTVYRPRIPEGNREMPAAVRERTQLPAGSAAVAGDSASRPGSENRVAPSAGVAPRDAAARASRTEVTRNDTGPQRPIPATSLGRTANTVRLPARLNSGTPVVRPEASVPAQPTRSRDGRSSTSLERQGTSTAANARPQSQQNLIASADQEDSRSMQRIESTRPARQRPQTGLPNDSASQPAAPVYRAPQQQAPQVSRYGQVPNSSYQQRNRSTAEVPRYAPAPRTEIPRANVPAPSYQAPIRNYTPPQPAYQAPRAASPEVPRYSPPAQQREFRSESPRFSAPAPGPERSSPAPAPAPSQSNQRSYSPQGSSGGGNGNSRGSTQPR
jgi:hypothetical protein